MPGKTNQLRINLSEKDSASLKEIAEALQIKESEVLKKGLQLMVLYANTKAKKNSSLIYKTSEDETDKEVLIL